MSLLAVEDLRVSFRSRRRVVEAVRGVSFTVEPGETLAIVGESGSGKSVTALSLMRLIEREGGTIDSGRILLGGRDLAALPEPAMRGLRGRELSMILQEPMTSLNPVITIGAQLVETILAHRQIETEEARGRALDMLRKVRMSDPERRLTQYPHELSGGMRQRVMIAMALSAEPGILIADEPTTALDVTIQAEILALLKALREETGTAVIFITHDMGVVAEIADRVVVMRHGEVVETGETAGLFAAPRANYTRELIAAVPRLGDGAPETMTRPDDGARLLEVERLVTRFALRKGMFGRVSAEVHAVDDVSLTLGPGETLGLVGESGSGKSTIGRSILRLVTPTSGAIRLNGQDIARASRSELLPLRREMAMIFQDPYASLNPRLSIEEAITEPLSIHTAMNREERRDIAVGLLERVSLPRDALSRYPHQFSGGQRQRIAIARALASRPKIIVADEPVSALDVSVQAQVIELLRELQQSDGIAYLFISHDLAVVEKMSHRVAVLREGRIVETGPTEAILRNPQHDYTRSLLQAVPIPDPSRRHLCRFSNRSEQASPIRRLGEPPRPQSFRVAGPGHMVAC